MAAAGEISPGGPTPRPLPPTPLWAPAALAVAVLAMSSGGLWFALLLDTPPVLKACWRLALTAALQAPLLAREAAAMPAAAPETAAFRRRWRAQLPLLGLAGAFLAVHFCAWSWSISHTSLTHSLLLVWTTPLIMVFLAAGRHAASRALARAWPAAAPLRPPAAAEGGVAPGSAPAPTAAAAAAEAEAEARFSPSAGFAAAASAEADGRRLVDVAVSAPPATEVPAALADWGATRLPWASPGALLRRLLAPEASLPPTLLEAAGSVLSFSAAALLIVSAGAGLDADAEVTVAGDLMAFLGAAAIIVYLEVGGALRKWMPLFHYAFPVTAASAVVAGLLSFAAEPSVTLVGTGAASLFGFLGDPSRFGLSFGAALFSGMLGHTMANLSLAHLSPLLVAVSGLWEPLLGSVLGFLVGVQSVPGPLTLVAGPLLIAGCLLTTLGARDSGFDAGALARRLFARGGGGSGAAEAARGAEQVRA